MDNFIFRYFKVTSKIKDLDHLRLTTLLLTDISTGVCDSNGDEIHIGQKLKKPVDCNQEVHGKWAIYEVKQQGLTPIISYLRSEKGDIFPEGYTATPLSDEYDRKMFCFAKDSLSLRPMDHLEIVSE